MVFGTLTGIKLKESLALLNQCTKFDIYVGCDILFRIRNKLLYLHPSKISF